MSIKSIYILMALCMFSHVAVSQDEQMCDAYIVLPQKGSDGSIGIAFEDISLNIYNLNGIKLESGGCTPDGYCLVPIPRKTKEFKLKVSGPSGAVFEPEEHAVNLVTNPNSCDGNFDFKLVGFGIESKVVIKGTNGSGFSTFKCDDTTLCQISVDLISKGSKQVVDTVHTDRTGVFKFASVSPGSYSMKAQAKNGITFAVSSVDCEIKLGTDKDCNNQLLQINGFMITGKAMSYDEPLQGVTIQLLSKSGQELATTESDSSGVYIFEDVSNGAYTVKASILDSKVKFKIEQSEIPVEVRDGITVVEQSFVVSGFSMMGRVINTKGYGIKNVVVKIDGQQKAITNDKGNYKLDEIVPGSYILEGVHENMLFEPMEIKITPHSKVIPELVVSEYKLCGRIAIINFNDKSKADAPSGQASFSKNRRVTLKDKQGHQERILAIDNENGDFCFEVKPQEYVITPVISAEEKSLGLRFKPSSKIVNVVDQPITDVLFEQIKYSATGSIECKEGKECEGINITIQSKKSGFKHTLSYTGSSYTVNDIVPGNYTVTIDKPEFCWENDQISFFIDDNSENNVAISSFKHTGYAIKYTANDDIEVEIGIMGENKRPTKATFSKGSHQHCFEKQGTIQVKPKSCYKYDQEFYTCKLGECDLNLQPVEYLVKGSILFDSQSEADKSEVSLTETFKNGKAKTTSLKLKKEYNSIYVFEYYTQANSVLTIEPKANDKTNLLFYPHSQDVSIYEDCISDFNTIRFESRKGLNLKGHVEGDIKDVSILVKIMGTDKVIHEEVSHDGKYNIGPLYDTERYEVIVTKEGYNIFAHESEAGVFVAEILSYLTLKFVDEDTNLPISSVLVAVSSGRSYKNNSYSNEDGVVQFFDLYSGTYYLRPLLKEFKFETLTMDVKEGERIDKTIKAKRVAFSVFGSVSLISGDSVANVLVEAQSTNSHHSEEAITASDGSYRIKGLLKDTRYEIRIKDTDDASESSQQVQTSIPQNKFVDVTGGDTKDIDFMVLLPPTKFYISGYINFQDDDTSLDGGKVELFVKGKEDSPVSRQKVGMSRLFTFTGLPLNRDYVLKVVPRKDESRNYQPYEQDITTQEIRSSKRDHLFVHIDINRVIR